MTTIIILAALAPIVVKALATSPRGAFTGAAAISGNDRPLLPEGTCASSGGQDLPNARCIAGTGVARDT